MNVLNSELVSILVRMLDMEPHLLLGPCVAGVVGLGQIF